MRARLGAVFVPVVLFVCAFALVACGGGSDAEGEIEETIETSVVSNDASKCTDVMTANFRSQSSGTKGEAAALAECEEEAGETSDDPDSVTVSAIEVDGSEARAEVAFVGGGFDGQTVEVALVDDDGWKLDELVRFAELDNEALAQSLEEQFEAASDEITPTQISCVGDGIRAAPQAEIEEFLFGGSSQKFVEFAEACE